MTEKLAPPVLSDSQLQQVSVLLYRHTGMVFGGSKRYYMERRIADRIVETGASGFADWLQIVRRDPVEIEALINAFTVNETYFYREAHQFRCLSRHMLAEVVREKGPGDRIRIWSAPCSTGEEPYSIAIWLLENWPVVDVYHVEIVGSDIDTEALERAAEAVYGERSLSRMPEQLVNRYFHAAESGRRQLIRDLRESVTFAPANLVDAASVAARGQFDVIFCRNVLIYFDDVARSRAIDNLYASLRPNGFICLGHTETMSRISDCFETRRFEDAVVYQKRAAP